MADPSVDLGKQRVLLVFRMAKYEARQLNRNLLGVLTTLITLAIIFGAVRFLVNVEIMPPPIEYWVLSAAVFGAAIGSWMRGRFRAETVDDMLARQDPVQLELIGMGALIQSYHRKKELGLATGPRPVHTLEQYATALAKQKTLPAVERTIERVTERREP